MTNLSTAAVSETRRRGPAKPIEVDFAKQPDDAFVRPSQLKAVGVPFSKSQIRRMTMSGDFPAPFLIGSTALAYRLGDLRVWLRTRVRKAA